MENLKSHLLVIHNRFQNLLPGAVNFLYGALVVMAMSRAPIVQIWTRMLPTGGGNDLNKNGQEALIFIINIPCLMLVSPHVKRLKIFRTWTPTTVLAVLFTMLFLSTAWSTLPGRTLWDISGITLSIFGAVYLALTNTIRRFVGVVFSGTSIVVMLSFWSVVRKWDSATHIESGFWRGVFENRNSLAPQAALLLLAGAFLIATAIVEKNSRLWLFVLSPVTLIAFVTLHETHSSTSVVGLFLGLVLFLLYWLIRFSMNRRAINVSLAGMYFAFSSELILVLVGIISYYESNRISSGFSRSGGFSGRIPIWNAGIEGIATRPFMGWGWSTAWLTDSFRATLPSTLLVQAWSHNIWIEFGLALGFFGLILSIIWFTWSYFQTLRISLTIPGGAWLVMFPCFFLVVSLMESMNYDFHELFALVVATFFISQKNEIKCRILATD